MEPERAIEIVQILADGVDPYSGERFPSSSPYQQADTVRALHLALEYDFGDSPQENYL